MGVRGMGREGNHCRRLKRRMMLTHRTAIWMPRAPVRLRQMTDAVARYRCRRLTLRCHAATETLSLPARLRHGH
ncbi:MAG: hypothetical protein OJF51_002636 [Nitrospira sp.]|nr:MAG: hypothetical protein OJF51_002636 [Nitrospira sp.]